MRDAFGAADPSRRRGSRIRRHRQADAGSGTLRTPTVSDRDGSDGGPASPAGETLRLDRTGPLSPGPLLVRRPCLGKGIRFLRKEKPQHVLAHRSRDGGRFPAKLYYPAPRPRHSWTLLRGGLDDYGACSPRPVAGGTRPIARRIRSTGTPRPDSAPSASGDSGGGS